MRPTHLDLSLVLFDVLLEQLGRLDVRGTASQSAKSVD